LLRCFVAFPQRYDGLRLLLRDNKIFRLGQMLSAMLGAAGTMPDSALERHRLLEALNAAYNMLDLRESWQSDRFARSAHRALDYLQQLLPVGGQNLDDRPEFASSSTDDRRQPVLENDVAGNSALGTPEVIATGHAHLDVAWLWPLWRTQQKVAHTVANALHLMERYPEYRFSMSQPQVYAFLKHDDPELYARLKQRVADGRFEPVGMMWLEVDCNIASGESLVRQLAFGARFFAQEFGEFGEINHVVWLPDVFGYSAALPQLMRLCGISCFMTTKISWNQFNRTPVDTFRWRGIDGSEVLAHFVTATDAPVRHSADPQSYTYNGMMTAGEVAGLWNHYRQKDINGELLYIYGYGDGGGGPTEEMLEAARVFAGLLAFPGVAPGRVDEYFRRLYARVWDDPRLPAWVGELYLEYHRGTYTGQARNKQANRASELLYREAEWLNAWATTLGGPNRQARLNEGWQLILLNQFHDILPGSSIAPVYEDSRAQYDEVRSIGDEVRDAASGAIVTSRGVEHDESSADATGSETPPTPAQEGLVVFNSLPWDRSEAVCIPLDGNGQPSGAGAAGQVVEQSQGGRALLLEVDVPSYGYSVVSPTFGGSLPESLAVGRSFIQNSELRLELDDAGEIASLYDLKHEREVIAAGARGNRLVAYEDRPLNWDAWDVDIFYEEKPYPVQDITGWKVVEEGPVRASIEIVRRLGNSTIKQRISLWRTGRRVDFVTEVEWQERQTLLRALFPLCLNAASATCEIQFGAVERPTHRNTSWDWARFEVCAHRWVDLAEGDYGVALLNDGKYGHSLHDNVLGLSLLKGAVFPDPDADRGLHRFTYSLLPHAGDWRAGQVVRRAYELNAPLRAARLQGRSAGERMSFLSADCDHVIVETVKVAEDGDGLVVRLYEAHNMRGPVTLRFARPVAGAEEVDLLERTVGAVDVEGDTVRFAVRPFEIKTLRVRLQG
jgi:alpha-mannosidase